MEGDYFESPNQRLWKDPLFNAVSYNNLRFWTLTTSQPYLRFPDYFYANLPNMHLFSTLCFFDISFAFQSVMDLPIQQTTPSPALRDHLSSGFLTECLFGCAYTASILSVNKLGGDSEEVFCRTPYACANTAELYLGKHSSKSSGCSQRANEGRLLLRNSNQRD